MANVATRTRRGRAPGTTTQQGTHANLGTQSPGQMGGSQQTSQQYQNYQNGLMGLQQWITSKAILPPSQKQLPQHAQFVQKILAQCQQFDQQQIA